MLTRGKAHLIKENNQHDQLVMMSNCPCVPSLCSKTRYVYRYSVHTIDDSFHTTVRK